MSSVQSNEEVMEVGIKSIPIYMYQKTFEVWSNLTPDNRNMLCEHTSFYFANVMVKMIDEGYISKEEYE